MHASSGQKNITCGETARGPKEEKERVGVRREPGRVGEGRSTKCGEEKEKGA